MDIAGIEAELKRINVPCRYYSINGSIAADTYILRQVYDYWETFYVDERGNQNEYHKFVNENMACEFFYMMLKSEMQY